MLVYEHWEMSITCVGWLVGWSIYRPQLETSYCIKVAALCGTPDSSMVGTWQFGALSGAPQVVGYDCCRWPLLHVILAPDNQVSHRTVRWLLFPSEPDSPACGTGQSVVLNRTVREWLHFLQVLDFAWYLLIFTYGLHNVLFWGVAFSKP